MNPQLLTLGIVGLGVAAAFAGTVVLVTNSSDIHRLPIGDSISITLPNNPTTGYQWSFDIVDGKSTLVEITSEVNNTDDAQNRIMVGTPGSVTYTITGKITGFCIVEFYYGRSWEHRPIKTLRYKVKVV
jgi:inhibitor of cysteine peptidase